MSQTRILIVGHGSQDEAANRQFEKTVAALQRKRPLWRVRFGYLEFARPRLQDALEEIAKNQEHVIVLPFFLAPANHVQRDIPEIIAQVQNKFPSSRIQLLPFIGQDPEFNGIVQDHLTSLDFQEKTQVYLVGRGSLNSRANQLLKERAKEIASQNTGKSIHAAFISLSSPLIDEVLENIEQKQRLFPLQHLIIVPYFLFEGTLISRLRQRVHQFSKKVPFNVTLTPPLGGHAKFLELAEKGIAKGFQMFFLEK